MQEEGENPLSDFTDNQEYLSPSQEAELMVQVDEILKTTIEPTEDRSSAPEIMN